MDDGTSSISPLDLYAQLGSESVPTVVDVPRDAPDPGSGRMVVSASHCPSEEVKAKGATPYDIRGVEFEHHGDSCSFDAIVSTYDIKAPALDQLTNGVGFSRKLSRPATMPIHSNGVVP